MERYFKKISARQLSPPPNANEDNAKRSRIESKLPESSMTSLDLPPQPMLDSSLADLPTDPGLRIRITDYDPTIQDQVRRRYLAKGPCQPPNHTYPFRDFGKKARRFNPAWFHEYQEWLEYSIAKDAVFCLCCYLFKPVTGEQSSGDTFVSEGFSNWKKKERLQTHVSSSAHNQAWNKCQALLKQLDSGGTSLNRSSRPLLDLDSGPLVEDPGLRIQIRDYNPDIRDQIRKLYLARGPYQPPNHTFPVKDFGKKARRFNPAWFHEYQDWLEYSIAKDAVFCLCCYLFRPVTGEQFGGDAFVGEGFSNWKKKERLQTHVASSAHDQAWSKCQALLNESDSNVASLNLPPQPLLDLDSRPLLEDPGLRIRIRDYNPNIRDQIRKIYLAKGPCQPRNCDFPSTDFGKKARRFNPAWFYEFQNWLEYSISKDAVFCLCCYLFEPDIGGGSFVRKGFSNWKKKESLHTHVASSAHNQAWSKCQALLNPRQHIENFLIKNSVHAQKESQAHLEASIDIEKEEL